MQRIIIKKIQEDTRYNEEDTKYNKEDIKILDINTFG